MSRNIPITEFDTLTVNPSMQILKALVPFLDYPLQRQVSLIIRVTELQQTMKFFSNPSSVSGFSSSATGYADKIHSIDDIFNNEKLLDSLLVYCPENYASMIKTFRQFSKMSDLFNMVNFANEGTDGNSGFNFSSIFNTDSNGNSGKAADSSDENPNEPNKPKDNSMTAYADEDGSDTKSGDNSNAAYNGNNNDNPPKSNSGSAPAGIFGKSAPNINLGSLFGSAPTDSLLNSFMKPEQQAMYDEYIRQLNNLNFDEPDSNSDH